MQFPSAIPEQRNKSSATVTSLRAASAPPNPGILERLSVWLGLSDERRPSQFDALPDAVILHITAWLDNTNHFMLSHTLITRVIYHSRMKPSPAGGDVLRRYASPANRLGRYAAGGPAGIRYMHSLGITHRYLVNQIRAGRMTVNDALQTIRNNREKISAWTLQAEQTIKSETETGILSSKSLNRAKGVLSIIGFEQVHHYIECGIIDNIDHLLYCRIDITGNIALFENFVRFRSALSDCIDQGKLSIEDFSKSEVEYQHGLALIARLNPDLTKWSREQLQQKVLPLTWRQAACIHTQEQFDRLLMQPNARRPAI